MKFEQRLLIALFLAVTACGDRRCAGSSPPSTVPEEPAPTAVVERKVSFDAMEKLIWGPGKDATFAQTTIVERETLARLVPLLRLGARAATPPNPSQWQADATAAGFQLEDWQLGGQRYWALLELPGRARGAGAYFFRVAPTVAGEDDNEILLQAPHAYFDLGTGMLAARLFFSPPEGARPRALFTNTIHRYQSSPGTREKRADSPSDVAHNPEHGYTTATVAYAQSGSHVRVIQLHGFAKVTDDDSSDDDDVVQAQPIEAVVSAGDRAGSSPLSGALATELGKTFGGEIRRYPEDVKKLGATTNVQGRMLRKIPGARFVHIEMSPKLRARLAKDIDDLRKFGAVVFDPGAGRE
ncbi:MAG: hypothetical protein WKG01_33750 [Kofleriaceae bacterium]